MIADPSKTPDLAIVIVNYRTPRYVIDCLETLLPELNGVDARVVIVDNCSGDGSVELIGNWIVNHAAEGQCTLEQAPANGGFASGNNIGINAIAARSYLLLNSDTLVRAGAIGRLLEVAGDDERIGLVSPRLEWPDGTPQESCFRYPGALSELCHAAQTGFVDRLFDRFIVPLPVKADRTYPEWTSFACVLIKNDVLREIGLLDDRFFMYFEDIEFCFRAARAGWKICNDPQARVVHLRGGSSPVKENTRLRKRLPRYYYESRTLYFFQTKGRIGLTLANLAWEIGRVISGARQLLGRSDKAAVERQWVDIWTNWLTPAAAYTNPGRRDGLDDEPAT